MPFYQLFLLLAVILRSTAAENATDVFDVESRIVGGSTAPAGRYPYYTFVEIRLASDETQFCSGFLVWQDIVITAANCIVDIDPTTILGVDVYVGLEAQDQRNAAEFRQVQIGIPHPLYNSNTFVNDIMALQLTSPVLNIQPVNLNFNPAEPIDFQRVDVFGFGSTDAAGTIFPNNLQTVDVNVIPFEQCNDANSFDGNVVDAIMICAGAITGGGRDACIGDAGSPLIIPGSDFGTDQVVGLSSFGIGCAEVRT